MESSVEIPEAGHRFDASQNALPREGTAKKKEEFPGFMGNMLPGNSFPQICVVSVSEFGPVTF
jgi:hypothetical protein